MTRRSWRRRWRRPGSWSADHGLDPQRVFDYVSAPVRPVPGRRVHVHPRVDARHPRTDHRPRRPLRRRDRPAQHARQLRDPRPGRVGRQRDPRQARSVGAVAAHVARVPHRFGPGHRAGRRRVRLAHVDRSFRASSRSTSCTAMPGGGSRSRRCCSRCSARGPGRATGSRPRRRRAYATWCHRHAWHADLWRARMPVIPHHEFAVDDGLGFVASSRALIEADAGRARPDRAHRAARPPRPASDRCRRARSTARRRASSTSSPPTSTPRSPSWPDSPGAARCGAARPAAATTPPPDRRAAAASGARGCRPTTRTGCGSTPTPRSTRRATGAHGGAASASAPTTAPTTIHPPYSRGNSGPNHRACHTWTSSCSSTMRVVPDAAARRAVDDVADREQEATPHAVAAGVDVTVATLAQLGPEVARPPLHERDGVGDQRAGRGEQRPRRVEHERQPADRAAPSGSTRRQPPRAPDGPAITAPAIAQPGVQPTSQPDAAPRVAPKTGRDRFERSRPGRATIGWRLRTRRPEPMCVSAG